MADFTGDLPPLADLIEVARQARAAVTDLPDAPDAARQARDQAARTALDRWAPAIDEYLDAHAAADWLGLAVASVYQERGKTRADGTPGWPDADIKMGRSFGWTRRTLVVHRASQAGRGAYGRGRPARRHAD